MEENQPTKNLQQDNCKKENEELSVDESIKRIFSFKFFNVEEFEYYKKNIYYIDLYNKYKKIND